MKSEKMRLEIAADDKKIRKVLIDIGYKPTCKSYYCMFKRCAKWSIGKKADELRAALDDKDTMVEMMKEAGLHPYIHNGGYFAGWRRFVEWMLR